LQLNAEQVIHSRPAFVALAFCQTFSESDDIFARMQRNTLSNAAVARTTTIQFTDNNIRTIRLLVGIKGCVSCAILFLKKK
jgi:hypothetical protein